MENLNLDILKRQCKQSIEELINSNKFPEAHYMIAEYEKNVPDDQEIISMKAIIAILEGELAKAWDYIHYGLTIEPFNGDLHYNLAYLYEVKNEFLNAYREYKRLSKFCSEDLLPSINEKLAECREHDIVKNYEVRKKVLIIAYIYPPLGGSGVQRTLKFTKYLRQLGWEPIVVTVGESKFYFKDEAMLAEVPQEMQIVRIAESNRIDTQCANELIALYRGIVGDNALMHEYITELNKSKENFQQFILIPDQNILWAREVLNKVAKEIDFDDIDLIYSTSGPYSDHVIGYYLTQKHQKPWVADFRDEWTNNPYLLKINRKHVTFRLQRKMEQNILNYASKVITTTRLATENYKKDFKVDIDKITTITNGYDETDFENMDTSPRKNRQFTIIHNGLFYMVRTPETFLTAVKNLLEKKLIRSEELRVVFSYTDNEQHWKEYVQKLNLEDLVTFKGYQSHEASLSLTSEADLLLLVVGPGEQNKSVYTGKVFEYLRFNRPILALSPEGSLVEELLCATDRGVNVDFNDIDKLEKAILQLYQDWQNGNVKSYEVTDAIKQYERKALSRQLCSIFDVEMVREIAKYDNSEKNKEFYDEIYKTGGWNKAYFKHYTEIYYYPIWTKAVSIIKATHDPNLIDIGCGPGQFANYLFDSKINKYQGIDLSSEAIQMAKARNKKHQDLFCVDNAFTTDVFDMKYNIAVLFEVLEHITDDLTVLQRIRKGSKVLFSVPNFYSSGHVRWFDSELKIYERYKDVVEIIDIFEFNISTTNKIYLVNGSRK